MYRMVFNETITDQLTFGQIMGKQNAPGSDRLSTSQQCHIGRTYGHDNTDATTKELSVNRVRTFYLCETKD